MTPNADYGTPWECSHRLHHGPPEQIDRNCPGCRIRRLVLADRKDAATAHDVVSGPCKCGAWH